MSQSIGQFKLNMDGLLEVLAGSLYANPVVGLRELIQNAHDSCTRYKVESQDTAYQPRIDITVDPDAHTLTISDNGSGLTASEIEAYLTTIGRSYTGELRGSLGLFDQEASEGLIGQFGFGFLSAFMLARQVTLQTHSWQPNSSPLLWVSAGGNSFELSAGERKRRGTTITLRLRSDASFLLDEEILATNVRKYANFLPIPIYVNEGWQPENEMTPPWKRRNATQAIQRFVKREFAMSSPLTVITLHDHVETLPNGESVDVPLSGFLFIPPSSVTSVREYGDLRVYIRSMFITEEEEELLPPWAKFVRGLVESPYLHPTASRESVRRDQNFSLVRKALGEQLSAALHTIQQNDRELWHRIVRGHSDLMTGWAVRDDDFFTQVAHILTFRTSQGQMTLPDYLKLSKGKFYYVTREIRSLQEKLLAEGNSAPAIEAVWFAVRPFLQKYAELYGPDTAQGHIDLVPLDEHATQLFKKVAQEPFVALLAACEGLGISAEIAGFEPAAVPALLIHPHDAELWHDTHNAIANDEIDPALAGLISGYVEEHVTKTPASTLFLNAHSPFIQKLAAAQANEQQQQLTLMLLYQTARLFSGKLMTATDAIGAFEGLTTSLDRLVHQ
ncbi:MAG: ATP-binding protein [Candidatus Promineifilaceae bacterium]